MGGSAPWLGARAVQPWALGVASSVVSEARASVVPLHRPGEEPDVILVARALEGAEWAKEALFRRHVKRALGLAYRILPEDDPEDVVQEAFLRAFDRLSRLAQPAAFGGWLASIIVSLAKMRLRKRRWLSRLGLQSAEPVDPDALFSRDAPLEVRVEVKEIYGVLHALTEQQRIALVLRRVEGYELEEIAATMEISVSTAKRRIAEAEAALAREASHE